MPATSCLDANTITELASGALDEAERCLALEHIDSCGACRRLAAVAALSGSPADDGPVGPRRGQRFAGYVITDTLGAGAMGAVYAARDEDLHRNVALKLVRSNDAAEGDDAAMHAQLLREATMVAALAHPNVVVIYEVGEFENQPFIAMELVEDGTLREWLAAAARTGGEILAMYRAAGEGLAAAHEAGIVHRDFKPDNVLVGKDGRPRVADFGLAFPMQGLEEIIAEAGGTWSDTWTAASLVVSSLPGRPALVGTPRYMSPEQLSGEGAGVAADQFAFCVSLWEGLYGEPPFDGDNLVTLMANIRGGCARQTARRDVPGWVRSIVLRGLAPDPKDRHPSMAHLVRALGRDPTRARRMWLSRGLAAAAASAAVVWAATASHRHPGDDPCTGTDPLQGVWDGAATDRIRTVFEATGRASGPDTATRVVALLDRYGADYAAMRREVCVATRDHTQAAGLIALRDACLERRRGQLQALVTVLGEKPDTAVLDKAVPAAAGLLPVAYCADTEALGARVRPPEDLGVRATVASLQPRADRLEGLYAAGKFQDVLSEGEPLLHEIATLPYVPLRAQVTVRVGDGRLQRGDFEGAKALLREGAALAAEARDDALAVTAWAHVLHILGERQRRFEEAAAIRTVGPTLLARAGDERARIAWSNAEGLVLYRMGKLEEAKATDELALALADKIKDDAAQATVLGNLGMVLVDMHDLPGARAAHERALSIREGALGPEHPLVAMALNNLGRVQSRLSDLAAAKTSYQRALVIWEKALGPEHPDVALAANNLAGVLANVGDWPAALALAERSLAIREKALGREHPDVSQSLFTVGSVLLRMGEAARAAPAFERGLAISESALGPTHHDLAYSLAGLGRARVELGQLDAAGPLLERALALVDKPASREDVLVQTLFALGQRERGRRNVAAARGWFERALALAAEQDACEVRFALADVLWPSPGERARARLLVEDAGAWYQRVGHGPGLELATRWLAAHR